MTSPEKSLSNLERSQYSKFLVLYINEDSSIQWAWVEKHKAVKLLTEHEQAGHSYSMKIIGLNKENILFDGVAGMTSGSNRYSINEISLE